MSTKHSNRSGSSGQQTSWINVDPHSDFSIYNIPFGIYRASDGHPRCCTAIGDFVVDLSVLADNHYFNNIAGLRSEVFKSASLNAFIALGKTCTGAVRLRVMELLHSDNTELQSRDDIRARALVPMNQATMLRPVEVTDYTDFYSSREHAGNIGSMLRDPANPLLPNWKHLPVAYHGRASSIVVSGTPVVRPHGQFKRRKEDEMPVFAPTERLDYELEVAFVIGRDSKLGEPVSLDDAHKFIFGFLLLNDWSARDIQSWEYAPLGPFLSKNFMTSISPWVVTSEALEPFRVQGPAPEVPLLPYLQYDGGLNYDIELEVHLAAKGQPAGLISSVNFKAMYWNVSQQLAHHTVTGCNIKIGDVMASGTVSGTAAKSQGCLMELCKNGTAPLQLNDGSTRIFLHDGDTVIMTGWAEKDWIRVGFGEVKGTVLPGIEWP